MLIRIADRLEQVAIFGMIGGGGAGLIGLIIYSITHPG
jgi:hypothetical protein